MINDIPHGERRQWLDLGLELGLLTTLERQTMVLWATGAGYKRIAYTLGVPRETARSRIQRGLMRIELAIRPSEEIDSA